MELVLARITASIGVEVRGIDLTRPLDGADIALLRDLIAEHLVVVIRDQPLTSEQHAALATSFAPLLTSPVQQITGRRAAVSTIEDTAERPPAGFPWHTDLSWMAEGPVLGFLHAVTIPAYGGDTMWVNTAAIYDRLSPGDRRRCDEMSVLHAPDDTLLASVELHHGRAAADRLRAEHPPVVQPLVRVHPMTGRRSLFLSPLYTRGAGDAGDDRLLERLHRMLDDPHVQMRWRWQSGDTVIWDETGTCHRALTDHHPQRRVMRRCVTAGR